MGALNTTHPNDSPPKSYTFWLLTSHIQTFWPPYHKSNKWRFRWLSHVIQGYQTGILHHRSEREKVTPMSNTNESSCKLGITQMDILSSPAKIWTHESQPFIHAWGGEKAKYTCPSSILKFLWPSGMSSGVAQFYEPMSLMRTTKQNPKHNRAELDVKEHG